MRTPLRGAAVLVGALSIAMMEACSSGASEGAPPTRSVASVDEVMDGIVIPGSDVIFDAVVYSNGELVQSPKTDDDWHRVRVQALAVAEAGNLLMMAPRARDTDEWMTFSRAMTGRAEAVAQAARDKSADRVLENGGQLYATCVACHRKYIDE
jgi:hypothetical protein